MIVLGIETSCDETAVALYSSTDGLLAHKVHSQSKTHAPYGGVVPELASRDHIRHLMPMVAELIEEHAQPDVVAYTRGPGLAGCLIVGATVAQSLAHAWGIPAIGIHHMEGHLLSPFLEKETDLDFPFLALLVSGGHTQLYWAEGYRNYRLLGETLDDAAGEAFDKTAVLLGLGYPGGGALEKLATTGDSKRFKLPITMKKSNTMNFSFSGLKTAVLRIVKKSEKKDYPDIAATFQNSVAQSISEKVKIALDTTAATWLTAAGGVARNSTLRNALGNIATAYGAKMRLVPLEFCTDNAAMIALAGCRQVEHFGITDEEDDDILPRWPLANLAHPQHKLSGETNL